MFNQIPADEVITKTAAALTANGMEAFVVDSGQAAKEKLAELIPAGAQIMNMTSKTLEAISAQDLIVNSGQYQPVKPQLGDKSLDPFMKRALGSASDWTVGSAHAVTHDGQIMIASNTGSQLGAEAYGSPHVVFVIGAQKIVKDREEGFKRIYEYVLPLESVRANKAYNITTGSFVSKMLLLNREVNKDRIKVILVKEVLGF